MREAGKVRVLKILCAINFHLQFERPQQTLLRPIASAGNTVFAQIPKGAEHSSRLFLRKHERRRSKKLTPPVGIDYEFFIEP
jgi:hypothetical protein